MTTQIPINSNSIIEAEDLTIAQCISLINNKLNMLLIDEKNKKKELEDIKRERKNLKFEHFSLLKQYQNYNKEIIEFQKALEIPLSKSAKIKKQQLQLIQQIDDSFYSNLIDISKSTNSLHNEFKNLITLLFIDPFHSPSDAFSFCKDKYGIKTIIEESEIAYKRLYTNENEKFNQLKEIMKDTENLQRVYPFETLIEILKNTIEIIELQNIIECKYKELNDKCDKHNFVFIQIKCIESNLKNKETFHKILSKRLKIISDLIECLNELQRQCKEENISKSISSNSNLLKKIKDTFSRLKDIDIYANNANYDGLSVLTIQSEYTQSDMAFVHGTTVTHINKEQKQQFLSEVKASNIKNKSVHNEEIISKSEKNEEDKDINISICDEMVDTNVKAHQTIDFEYIHKISCRYNYHTSNNNIDFYETDIKNKESDILDKYNLFQKEEPLRINTYPKQKVLILENNDERETCCSSGCAYSST